MPTTARIPTSTQSFAILLRLKSRLLRNRLRQLVDQSPSRLLAVIVFVIGVWAGLYFLFDHVFRFMRRFEQSIVAIPYVFHIFFMAMTFLLALSTGVIAYSALFSRSEQSLLMASPHRPKAIVLIMYLESLFFASWSLLLLGLPLMFAVGQSPGLSWQFYLTFLIAFLGFVPIPGALGLAAAWFVAMFLPRSAKRVLMWVSGLALLITVLWWGRLWTATSGDAAEWVRGFLGELQYLKAALLPSTWITNAIRASLEGRPGDAVFYLGVTISTAVFLSWAAVNLVGGGLLTAFGRAYAAPVRTMSYTGWISLALTRACFFYLPKPIRMIILKDVRTFLRDPVQWSQLVILFGLLAIYLFYLPRTRPEGFNPEWKVFICFLNFGAITLILSTFTSRFVFPMISVEGRQMWVLGMLPVPRAAIIWAKFNFALTITAAAALSVTFLSVRALQLSTALAVIQCAGTLSTCVGLCGLAVGLGARMPNYAETNTSRISSGVGGTVNLIVSIGLVTVSILLMGLLCWGMAQSGRIDGIASLPLLAAFAAQLAVGFAAGLSAMRMGVRAFERASF